MNQRLLQTLFLALILAGACGGWFGGMKSIEDTAINYDGKVVFTTEEEYTTFKEIIGNEAVYISEVQVLSSAPPIVVSFEVMTSTEYEFPYGNRDSWTRYALYGLFAFMGGLAMAVIAYLIDKKFLSRY